MSIRKAIPNVQIGSKDGMQQLLANKNTLPALISLAQSDSIELKDIGTACIGKIAGANSDFRRFV